MTYWSQHVRWHTSGRVIRKRGTYWDKEIRYPPLVLGPRVTVLGPATVYVPPSTVGDHAAEEDGIEPGEGALEACDEAPADGEEGVACVVHLAREAVPAVNEDNVAVGRGDGLGVLNRLPRHLREGAAPDDLAALRLPEAILLAVARVPNPVDEEVADVEGRQRISVPVVFGRVVRGEVDGAVAVRERDAGHVPEDEHKAPFLVVHIPVGWFSADSLSGE